MNIEKLLKEIDSEKEKIASEIKVNNKQFYDKFYEKDMILLSPLLTVAIGIAFYSDVSKTYSIGCVITAFACAISPILPLILSCFATKNLSFSYHFKSVFKKEKLRKNLTAEQKRIVYNQQINNDFLKKIALNMDKSEFKDFLRECEGTVTLEKLENFIYPNDEKRKRTNSIEELTTVIYEENKFKVDNLEEKQ